MPTIAAGQSKATCRKLPDAVARARVAHHIPKRDAPAAELVPSPPQTPLFGALAGNVRKEGDIVSPLKNAWEAVTR
ncbi:MAG: hypothetical protein LBU11_12070 [Zoogloeaceae bacterium]|nr:hypothetical protein [Zoogloeaceae bacterium]